MDKWNYQNLGWGNQGKKSATLLDSRELFYGCRLNACQVRAMRLIQNATRRVTFSRVVASILFFSREKTEGYIRLATSSTISRFMSTFERENQLTFTVCSIASFVNKSPLWSNEIIILGLQNNPSVGELIQKMIQHDPTKRITSNEVKHQLSQISNDQRCNSSKKQFPQKSFSGKRDLVYRLSVTQQRILAPTKQAALSEKKFTKIVKNFK